MLKKIARTIRDPILFTEDDPEGFKKAETTYGGGIGLFTTQPFKKNEFLLNYRGKHCVDLKDDDPIENNYAFSYKYESKSWIVDAQDPNISGLARYINDKDCYHAANCVPKGERLRINDVLKFTICIKASRDIAEGNQF